MELDLNKATYYFCYARRPARSIARCIHEEFPIPL
jgi:hypothetical protein